ncbi:hypothetical protein FHP89_13935 [Denitromonas ohlonensis]|uniref:Single Cache domain-containing protein n=2 Tax=Denitromonas TaxID=139331 RepID=A0A557SDF0_9RHOO|nr:hypothetical protein FHP90_13900 [Denitromonas ohlonensis]TVO75445.1 hypothetical protein FHP89_13935 [Denitromonas ohlonensis]
MTHAKFILPLVLAGVLSMPLSPVLAAADTGAPTTSQPAEAARARALLDRAVRHMMSAGDRALSAFSRAGEFTDGDLYVYALDTRGVLLASGGASYSFIGRDMLDYRDPDGKPLFAEILDGALKHGGGSIEYRWLNLQRGTVERKIAYYQAVGSRILAVGYYAPRATPEQAMSVLWRAVDELKRNAPAAAFAAFNDINGSFVRDDTYVFVVGITDRRMHAHGAMPRLIGRNVAELRDVDGKQIIDQMLNIVSTADAGGLDYKWRNPVTGEIEKKHTFVRRVGDYMVGVGYYEP